MSILISGRLAAMCRAVENERPVLEQECIYVRTATDWPFGREPDVHIEHIAAMSIVGFKPRFKLRNALTLVAGSQMAYVSIEYVCIVMTFSLEVP